MSSSLAFAAFQEVDDGRNLNPSIVDNEWLDEINLHFGEWMKQIIDWTDQNLGWLLSLIRWPFQFLFDLLMNEDPGRTSIMDIPWYWVAIAFFVIGSIARNTRVGLMVGLMVATCGLLGPDYWSVTAKTFGMIAVSVFLCALIGVPIGILCGRIDAVWNAVRPTLDAMQVVHSFVYMLPFIFFWGVGEVSATMVTMVFALPPIVRLTNLGVRQVPEDVVEASRSYGASELRVLTDVQLPLARPAIMTGLNQTLLLAISMLGIAALMGAENLGTLLWRAISSQNLPLAASGGLAFFLVAVVLDRISQREIDDDMSLVERIRQALALRKDPEALEGLVAEEADKRSALTEEPVQPDEAPAPVSSRERIGLLVAGAGAILAALSVFLPWGADAGLISGWGRTEDETDLVGASFSGIEASGANMFGVAVLLLSVIAALAAFRPLFSFEDSASTRINQVQFMLFGGLGVVAVLIWLLNMFGSGVGALATIGMLLFAGAAVLVIVDTWIRGSARLGADGALIASLGALGAALGYLLANESPLTVQYSHQIGLYVALIGTIVASTGALLAMTTAPYGPLRPLSLNTNVGAIIGVIFGLILLFVGSYAVWMVDLRTDSLITPEMQAEIDRLSEEAGDDINKQISNGQKITNMINLAKSAAAPQYYGLGDGQQVNERWVFTGIQSDFLEMCGPIDLCDDERYSTPGAREENADRFSGTLTTLVADGQLEADDTLRLERNPRSTNGPGLGWPTVVLGALSGLFAIASSGVFGRGEGLVWRAGTLAAGLGLASLMIPVSWIFSFTRSGHPAAITGAGAFFAAVAAFVLFALGRGAISEFRRKKVYAELKSAETTISLSDETTKEAQAVLAGSGSA